jgi:hypothetical protein
MVPLVVVAGFAIDHSVEVTKVALLDVDPFEPAAYRLSRQHDTIGRTT